ncbi:hypothetical protein P7K49_009736 [Saguinus oedipus]|uniref:DEAD-box helicase OB fold domain-containing protein n=1 Tax=Saguinus oedipus TaxID=9490 RepID=A0ABQ9VLF1_SAGOE|nr:hypothetical protein P7K49_009736 [Saguinus oedipus]
MLLCSRTIRDDHELHIHPASVLYAEKPPRWAKKGWGNRASLKQLHTTQVAKKVLSLHSLFAGAPPVSFHQLRLIYWVIYNEVIQTSKYYMRDVTAIESAWLLELAPHFYQQGTDFPPCAKA